MMDGIKQEYQKFYDLLDSSAPGGQGPAMELIMRTLDQEGMQATQNCEVNNTNASHIQHLSNNSSGSGNNNNNLISSSVVASSSNSNGGMHNTDNNNAHSMMASVTVIDGTKNGNQSMDQVQEAIQLSGKLELHPNLVLQSLGISTGDEDESNTLNSNNNNSGNVNNCSSVSEDGITLNGGGGGSSSDMDTSGSGGGYVSGGGGDRPHICQICNASYKTRTHLRRHMFVHLNNRPYPCTDCGKGFNRKEHLTKHIEAVHSGTKHKCQYCGKEISRKDHLSRHIKNMHPTLAGITKETDQSVLKLQLPCSQKQNARLSFLTPTYPTPSGLSASSLIKEMRVINNIKSSSVGDNSATNLETQQESQDQESSQTATVVDSSAETNMSILDQAFQHFTQVSIIPGGSIVVPGALPGQIAATVTVGNPIISSTSSSTTDNNSGMRNSSLSLNDSLIIDNKMHPNNIRSNGSIPFSVSNGLVSLTNLSMSLGGQMRELPFGDCENGVIGLSKKKPSKVLPCTECESTFTSEKEYSAHLRSHKPQNFRCTECPRAYTRREKLTEHIRCFHQGQKFKCEYCGKELSRKDHVLRHVRSIHPEVLASRFTAHLQETSVDCGQDGMSGNIVLSSGANGGNISSSSAMNEMGVLLRSVCHVCLKVFGTSYHLSRHIDSCHKGDVRPYSCNSCSKQFKRKDHLTKHMKSHCPSTRDGNNRNSICNSDGTSTTTTASRSAKVPNKNKSSRDDNHQKSSSSSQGKSDKSKSNAVQSTKKDLQSTKTDNNSRMKETESEFNLAMINSFIAENVNVVVEETDLANLINSDQLGQSGNSGSNSSVGSERESRENVLNLDDVEETRDSSSVSLTTAISSQNNNTNNNSFRHPLIQHDVNSTSTLNKIAY